MDQGGQLDFERLMMFEQARIMCESTYQQNPKDADNLTKWGGALLELSQFGEINESKRMIGDATSKLEEALAIEPAKHEALWCLGNAFTSQAFLTPDRDDADVFFEQATQCFQKAVNENPGDEHYRKSLEACSQAPLLHMEIHKQGFGQSQQTLGGGSSASSNSKTSVKKKKSSDLKYDICGWIILAVGIVAWIGMAKSHVPPPSPR